MASGERFWDAAEAMPRGELAALQVQRLRACVERLKGAGNPFYRERLAPIHPEDLHTLDDLRRLPFTTKDDIRRNYPFGLFVAPSSEIVRIHASSGTTGKPTVVGYTRSDLELWSGLVARGLVAAGIGPGDVFQNALGYGLFTGGLGFHEAATRLGAAVVPASSGNTPRQVMLLRDFGVTALASTPSYAIYVAEVAAAEGIDLRTLPLRAACVGAEPMSDGLRREIEERMGVTVYEQFGLSEIIGPGVAASCGHGEGMHLWEDHFIAEVLDPDSHEPVAEGEVGELVLTAPTKQAFPLLRYRTRDRTRLEREACACGRTSVRLARILGRTDDMLIVRGVNVFPSQIEHALVGVPGLVPQYQIVLGTRADRQDDIRVRVETAAEPQEPAELAALEARVRETLHSVLGLSVLVELLPPRTIQRSDGKAVRVVDQRAKG